MNIIAYNKYKDYIFTIETESKPKTKPIIEYDEDSFGNSDDEKIEIFDFRLIKINNLLGEEFNKIDDFKVNKKYNIWKIKMNKFVGIFFEDYEQAFYHNFIKNKQYNLFPNGHSGYVKEYFIEKYEYNRSNGQIKSEYFHINGKIQGKYKEYDTKGKLIKEIDYVDGLINGFHKSWDNYDYCIDDYCIDEYHNGIRHGKSIKYIKNRTADIKNYSHGALETYTMFYFNSDIIMEEQKIIDGDKICIKYDREGNIAKKHIYKNGKCKQIIPAI